MPGSKTSIEKSKEHKNRLEHIKRVAEKEIKLVEFIKDGLHPIGITSCSWRIVCLLVLAGCNHRPFKITSLVDGHLCSHATVLRHVSRLEKNGFITRVRTSTDARVWNIAATMKLLNFFHRFVDRFH